MFDDVVGNDRGGTTGAEWQVLGIGEDEAHRGVGRLLLRDLLRQGKDAGADVSAHYVASESGETKRDLGSRPATDVDDEAGRDLWGQLRALPLGDELRAVLGDLVFTAGIVGSERAAVVGVKTFNLFCVAGSADPIRLGVMRIVPLGHDEILPDGAHNSTDRESTVTGP